MELPPRDPALDQLDLLVGDWDTEATHPKIEGTMRGRTTFEWLTGRCFLIQRAENTDPVPSSISIIGGGDTPGTWPMRYHDSRGVERIYQFSFRDRVMRFWRDEPGFMQRATGTFEDGDRTLRLRSELAENGGPFKPDLEMTFRRR